MAAIAAATMLAAATAQAGLLNLPRPQSSSPDGQIELIAVHHAYRHHYARHHYTRYYRHSSGGAFPAAIIGGIIGGALNNGCYFNDCGYGYGYDGGNYGGGYGGYGGAGLQGWRRLRCGHGGGPRWRIPWRRRPRGGFHGGGGGHGGGGHGGGAIAEPMADCRVKVDSEPALTASFPQGILTAAITHLSAARIQGYKPPSS